MAKTTTLQSKPIDSHYTTCDKCGTKILKGDIRHMNNGDDVCEYCSDSYDDDQKDY